MNYELTIIVACRNEISNLPTLLESIENQTFKPSQVIFVDDNSTDETYNFLLNYSQNHNYIKVIKNSSRGKKSALIEAAKIAKSEYLVFTDADCLLNKDYLYLANQYLSTHHSDMLLGAVDIIDEKGIFNIIEKIEFASLQAVTAFSALIKNPIMCNGANLIVRRTKYLQYIDKINKNIASGDDMFMLHAFKKNKETIDYLYKSNYIIQTKGTNSLKKFILQRTRWAAKSINYKDISTIITALSVVFINILLLISLFFTPTFFFLIFIIENIILLPFMVKYKQMRALKYYPLLFPLMSILYPLYIIIILISTLFYDKTTQHWK